MHLINSDKTLSYSLTLLQQNMYVHSSLTERPWSYVQQIVIHLSSEVVDTEAMGRAWSELVIAHPSLRNVIVADNSGLPTQRVAPPCPIEPAQHDWRDLDQAQIAEALSRFLAEDRAMGVDATVAPAFRIAVFHRDPEQSILVWTFPHSLLDGRSFAPLLDEVFQRYARIRSDSATPEPQTGPDDVFEAHCRALAGMSHADGEAHFGKALAGWEGSEGLVRRDTSPTRKAELSLHLTEAETNAVSALAARAGVATSTVVLAAWGVVLARVSGQADVVFGNTRNGRHIVGGSAAAAGCFITTVPVRLQLDTSLTLGTALAQMRAEQMAVRPFEHTPLTNVRRHLDIPPGRQIFDSVVLFEQGTLGEQVRNLGGDWLHRRVDLFEEGDMPVSVAAYMGPRMRIVVEYDPALVPGGAGLVTYMQQFLRALGSASLDAPLGGISMLDAVASQRLVDLAGPEPVIAPDTATCIDRFEQTAAQWPDHIALMQPGCAPITYGALDQAAAQLAGNLAASGVQPGDIIGICMARGADFITAMLAIWKAGAAFVPMDPTYPCEALDIIAQDSGARLVLIDAVAPALEAATRNIRDLDAGRAPAQGGRGRKGADLAYVTFTSGSTGRPKGVMVTHRSLAAHADAVIPQFGLHQQDRVLQFAALSFDVALEEIVPTLVSGATLALRSDAMAQSVTEFLEQSDSLGITVVNLPTGFWVAVTEVLDSFDHPFSPKVRLVVVGVNGCRCRC